MSGAGFGAPAGSGTGLVGARLELGHLRLPLWCFRDFPAAVGDRIFHPQGAVENALFQVFARK